jgi:hypothetical protein
VIIDKWGERGEKKHERREPVLASPRRRTPMKTLLPLLALLLLPVSLEALTIQQSAAIVANNCASGGVGLLVEPGDNPLLTLNCTGVGFPFMLSVGVIVGPFPQLHPAPATVVYRLLENGVEVQAGEIAIPASIGGVGSLFAGFEYDPLAHFCCYWGETVQYMATFRLADQNPTYEFQLFEPTPEPTTLLLWGTGAAGLGLARRFRRGRQHAA